MKKTVQQFVRDPLFHFLVLGSLLFMLASNVGQNKTTNSYEIRITASDIARLSSAWVQQWRRPPTGRELNDLIQTEIRDQILFQEAQAFGLDENDIIVRRRLAQKMEFLIEAETMGSDVEQAALDTYFTQHAEAYKTAATISFDHIYFSPDTRVSPERDAAQALERIKTQSAQHTNAKNLGDPFPVKTGDKMPILAIVREFGADFSMDIQNLSLAEWDGPVRSGLGWHLVIVLQVEAAVIPRLEDVRARVVADYLRARRTENLANAYAEIRQKYQIILPVEFEVQKSNVN